MPKLIILGSSNAIPDPDHENTHMVLVGSSRTVMIDCVNNPILRLGQAGVSHDDLTDLVLTHFHPDHVSGVPLLLMNMWLMGRVRPLQIHGLAHTLDRLEELMGFYGWEDWPGFFKVTFHRVPEQEISPVLACDEFNVVASPVQHFIPTLGLALNIHRPAKKVVYSCDTEPCGALLRLAANADLLFHEAAGPKPGHSSAAQAGETAKTVKAGALYLIHYPTGDCRADDLVTEARRFFDGPVYLAQDFMTFDFT